LRAGSIVTIALLGLVLARPALSAPPVNPASLSPPRWEGVYDYRNTVNLRWFRVQGAVGYLVERQVGEKDDFRELARVTNPLFDDPVNFPGKVVGYRIFALDSAGRQGPPSDPRYIKVEAQERQELDPPTWAPFMLLREGIALSWSHPDQSNVLAFNLYRRKKTSEPFTLLTSGPDTTYLDRNVLPQSSYQYAVAAVSRTLQESDQSTVMKVTFTPPEAVLRKDPSKKGVLIEDLVSLTEVVKTFGPDRFGFVSPIDVDWWPTRGWLYVSDVATGVITVINERDEIVHRLGGRGNSPWNFENLLGICVDGNGFVYGTDSYRGEIVIFKPDGAFHKRIKLLDQVKEYFGREFTTRFPVFRFGLLDIVVEEDGSLLVVDNPNGWIYVLDRQERLARIIGEKGEEAGQFHYPTFLALQGPGRVIVSDTLNSRLQLVTVLGAPERVIGEKGVAVGQLICPKGLAFDDRGMLFVADSYLNAIQVFDQQGAFVTILADREGKILDLGLPNGLAWLGEDRLAICEKITRRVQVRRVTLGARTLFFSAPAERAPEEKKR